jgi:hypothetical protein
VAEELRAASRSALDEGASTAEVAAAMDRRRRALRLLDTAGDPDGPIPAC